jgi:tRNA threonylcarbamoyladenosine biosynthesis protein TsaE
MNKKDFVGKTFATNSFKETQKLGRDFAKTLEKGDIVCLYGNLGSGKTTFTQGLAQGLGIKNRIISPTFIIVRSYELGAMSSFYHIDLYRMENEKDIEGLGIEEILDSKSSIAAIEWAEKLKDKSPKKRIDIEFSYEKNNVRKITFRSLNQ